MKKIYVVGPYNDYANWLTDHELTNELEKADIVLFAGGSDVSPQLYGGEAGAKLCYNNPSRDEYEIDIFTQAKKLNKNMLGICRGSQFLCVMAGGKLVQDASFHGGYSHSIVNKYNEYFLVNSTHHQMMYPFNLPEDKYEVMYWTHSSDGPRSPEVVIDGETYLKGTKEYETVMPCECEIVKFPEIKSLGIQCHPEMMFDILNSIHPNNIPHFIEYERSMGMLIREVNEFFYSEI